MESATAVGGFKPVVWCGWAERGVGCEGVRVGAEKWGGGGGGGARERRALERWGGWVGGSLAEGYGEGAGGAILSKKRLGGRAGGES